MKVNSCREVWATVFADDDKTDADRVWKDSPANEDIDKASLDTGIPANRFLLLLQDADTIQVPT